MMSERDKENLRMLVIQKLPETYDVFDIEAEMDSSISFEENKRIILDKLEVLKEQKENYQTQKEYNILKQINMVEQRTEGDFWEEIKDNINILVCVADTGEGKTAFCFKHLGIYDKPVYVYKHPNPRIIEAIGFHNMNSITKMNRLKDAVVYFDEPQLSFPCQDKQTNTMFLMLCSLARQNNLTMVFSTSDTRWINKGLESYVSHWVIKTIDIKLVKNGSIIKKIVRDIMPLASEELLLNKDEYLFYNRGNQHNGLHSFKLPLYFDDRLSRAYRYK